MVKVTLEPVAARTAETRRAWAIGKSRALAKRRLEIEAGAPRATGTAIGAAVERYFEDHPQLGDKTVRDYRAAADKLLAWATKEGVKSADDLTRARLLGFRAGLVKEPKQVTKAGQKRGKRATSSKPRSPHSVNRELRSVRVILGYLGELDLLSKIRDGDLRRALKKLPVATERVEYLAPGELQALLEAALRHDAETYVETREEHAGGQPPGTTARYPAIAPFVAVVLLSGMRLGEAIELEWKQVDLEALDGTGAKVGEIHLSGATKTKKARTVGLEVSPALRRVLAALRLRSGGKGLVWSETRDAAAAAMKRLRADYGAPPKAGWQILRATCGTFLTNAPAIFGSASAYHSARQLGHSVAVAEKHYLGLMRGISHDARDLETAMQIGAQLETVIDAIGARPATKERRAG